MDGELLLPAFFGFLPCRPGVCCFGDDALAYGELLSWRELLLHAFAVDEGSAGGDGEEEEAHRRPRVRSERWEGGDGSAIAIKSPLWRSN